MLRGSAGADLLDGGDGADTASYGSSTTAVNAALDGGFASSGDAAGDTFAGIEYLQGTNAAVGDSLRGDAAINVLTGYNGDDTLRGMSGSDKLTGGAGSDSLRGDLGNDQYYYNATTEGGDSILDFTNAANDNDSFAIRSTAFGGLPTGTLAATRFVVRAADNLAQDGDDTFIFQTSTRQLWYDPTGNATAGDQVLIATLQAGATMTNVDVIMF